MPVGDKQMRNPGSSFSVGTPGSESFGARGLSLSLRILGEIAAREKELPPEKIAAVRSEAEKACYSMSQRGSLGPSNCMLVARKAWADAYASVRNSISAAAMVKTGDKATFLFRPSDFSGGAPIPSQLIGSLRLLHSSLLVPICVSLGSSKGYEVREGISSRNKAHSEGKGCRFFIPGFTGAEIDGVARGFSFGIICRFEDEVFITIPMTTREGWPLVGVTMTSDEYYGEMR